MAEAERLGDAVARQDALYERHRILLGYLMALGWRLAAATPPRFDATLKLPEDQCTLTKDVYRPFRVWVNGGTASPIRSMTASAGSITT